MKKISLCVLDDWKSIEDFLRKGLLISGMRIKKQKLSRSFLEKNILSRSHLEFPLDLINTDASPFYTGPPLDIVFEDGNILALNKLPGIHTHSLRYGEGNNCESFLRSKGYGMFKKKTQGGPLYRLDFETSGVVICVKKYNLWKKLRENYHQIVKKKYYTAIVEGKQNKLGVFTHALSPSGKKGHRMKASIGDEAVMEIKKVFYLPDANLTLLLISLETGYRHQIRCQLSALKMPVHGDVLYGGKKAERMFLHALCYELAWEKEHYEIKCKKAFLFDRFCDLNCLL